MSTETTTIPADVAAHVLFHFGHKGIPAGDWSESLITLIARADMVNKAKLTAVFPDYAGAVLLAQYADDGINVLKDIAAGRCTRCKQDDGPLTPSGMCEPCAAPMPLDGVA
ncbi:hypothetical protein [Streptomyces griseoloalbus]|uniref:Uncharacterized protein n=1 Tax=Streptomyces griseoloalbus TaxID=67303 RepID=A0A7W8BXY0_9ACTN|nr:hypothetical protein [Streptomyces albaduncus]MBB5130258.1 hypothetical protein [Streptomyces albaduncus]GGW83246.1 hypothetical protein GCM10010340_70680 [Streptomyces albaduncus]